MYNIVLINIYDVILKSNFLKYTIPDTSGFIL